MGGTDPNNMLNKLVGEDGGQILQWKRRAEQYLVRRGGCLAGGQCGGVQLPRLQVAWHAFCFAAQTITHSPPRRSPTPWRQVASGLKYTIIHPGGLVDEEGGKRRLAVDVDDGLLTRKVRSIPRADVAALAVGCLGLPTAINRSFDVCADPAGEGEPSGDWAALLESLGGRSCDYSINSQAEPASKVAA